MSRDLMSRHFDLRRRSGQMRRRVRCVAAIAALAALTAIVVLPDILSPLAATAGAAPAAPAAPVPVAAAPAALPPGTARGPENIADVAEQVIDAVVNVSTSQKVDARMGTDLPDLPPGSPMEEFFEEFFKNRRGPGGQGGQGEPIAPRRINSLGSGFIIDRRAWSSPTTTSSPTPTRSTSSSTTAPSCRRSWSARIQRAISRCCA